MKLLKFSTIFLKSVLVSQGKWPTQEWWDQGENVWQEEPRLNTGTKITDRTINYILTHLFKIIHGKIIASLSFQVGDQTVDISLIRDPGIENPTGQYDEDNNIITIKFKKLTYQYVEEIKEILSHEIQHALRHNKAPNINPLIYSLARAFLKFVEDGMGRENAFELSLNEIPPGQQENIRLWYKEAFMKLPLTEIENIYNIHHENDFQEIEADIGPLLIKLENDPRTSSITDHETMKNHIRKTWRAIRGDEIPESLLNEMTGYMLKPQN